MVKDLKRQCSCCKYDEGSIRKQSGELVVMASDVRCTRCKSMDAERNPRRNDIFKLKYPAPDKAVYAFLEGNEIVYIGESDNCSFRINNHFNNKSPINNSVFKEINVLERKKRFSYVILWEGDNDEYRKSQEKELIKLHQPKFNKAFR